MTNDVIRRQVLQKIAFVCIIKSTKKCSNKAKTSHSLSASPEGFIISRSHNLLISPEQLALGWPDLMQTLQPHQLDRLIINWKAAHEDQRCGKMK
jgi:hypothetical protein